MVAPIKLARGKIYLDMDLAIITFNSSNTYPVAELGDSTEAKSGFEAYVVGFPDAFADVSERKLYYRKCGDTEQTLQRR